MAGGGSSELRKLAEEYDGLAEDHERVVGRLAELAGAVKDLQRAVAGLQGALLGGDVAPRTSQRSGGPPVGGELLAGGAGAERSKAAKSSKPSAKRSPAKSAGQGK